MSFSMKFSLPVNMKDHNIVEVSWDTDVYTYAPATPKQEVDIHHIKTIKQRQFLLG